MAMYALGTRGLVDSLAAVTQGEPLAQVWFADDSTSGGTVDSVKKWWEHLKETGPKYGYYPKPSKTHIIAKSQEIKERVEELFGSEGIQVTVDGQRHIGAVIGSENFKEEFVMKKVKNWTEDI